MPLMPRPTPPPKKSPEEPVKKQSLERPQKAGESVREVFRSIGGKVIYFVPDEQSQKGINYLSYRAEKGEIKPWLDQAYLKGEAQFETRKGENFTLVYNRAEKKYHLKTRPSEPRHGLL
jgi:hypothetical protein